MPSHHYEPVPLEDEDFSPTTAPPSFHTIALSPSPSPSQPQPQTPILPHLNDETATTFIPHNQRPSPSSLPVPILSNATDGLSIWAPSEPEEEEDGDLVARDEILLQLTNRIEAIELHFANTPMTGKKELDIETAIARQEAEAEKKQWKGRRNEFWTTVVVMLFLFWFGAVLGVGIVVPVLRRGRGSS